MEAYQWILDYWELVFLVVVPFGWKILMAWKRKMLDEVYATKAELRCAIDRVEKSVTKTITDHAREDAHFQRHLNAKMDANHNEIKDLIIQHLVKRDAK
jgi:hypothetical protein